MCACRCRPGSFCVPSRPSRKRCRHGHSGHAALLLGSRIRSLPAAWQPAFPVTHSQPQRQQRCPELSPHSPQRTVGREGSVCGRRVPPPGVPPPPAPQGSAEAPAPRPISPESPRLVTLALGLMGQGFPAGSGVPWPGRAGRQAGASGAAVPGPTPPRRSGQCLLLAQR